MTKTGMKHVVVVGVPDKRFHEVCVCYVTEPGQEMSPEDLKQFYKNLVGQDTMAGLEEMPKYFLRFKYLPMLGNGKINKQQVRFDAIQQLQLSEKM
jgi:acyl-CoA synthetase (AMP-forming)/AMP-acid ligase II